MIVDASVVLSAFFPDEAQSNAQALIRDHVAGRITLKAPALLPYELSNAVWQAERRQRISSNQANEIIKTFANLEIDIISQTLGEMLPLARQFNISAYDAAYLALAEKLSKSFITGDERLYKIIAKHLEWVSWIGDYSTPNE